MECATKYKLFRINIEIVNNWEKWIEQGIGVNRQESKLKKEKEKECCWSIILWMEPRVWKRLKKAKKLKKKDFPTLGNFKNKIKYM